jgi:hypothetical protein
MRRQTVGTSGFESSIAADSANLAIEHNSERLAALVVPGGAGALVQHGSVAPSGLC